MNNYSILKIRIKKSEGYRASAYRDQLGFYTIGYGHLIKKNENHFLSNKYKKEYLNKIFDLDFNRAIKNYYKFYKTKKHNKNTKEVYVEMIFQLGIKKQRKFKKMNNYVEKKLFHMAALEMKDSLWFNQTPKRVNSLIRILLKNEK